VIEAVKRITLAQKTMPSYFEPIMPMPDTPPSKQEMLECLQRSGYCFESRLAKMLSTMGLFVETSQAYYDKRTEKSREIDLVVEPGFERHTPLAAKVCVQTTWVIEAINNLLPVVLLTPKVWTPNSSLEPYIPQHITPPETTDPHPFIDVFYSNIYDVPGWKPFTQYCSFSRKKQNDELMASHGEDLYGSLQKVVDYVFYLWGLAGKWMPDDASGFWRIFNWQPVIVLQNDLYVFQQNSTGIDDLVPITQGQLEYNFHLEGEPKSVVVTFVTESALADFVNGVLSRNAGIEKELCERRLRSQKPQ
jgi:hypothetical protein